MWRLPACFLGYWADGLVCRFHPQRLVFFTSVFQMDHAGPHMLLSFVEAGLGVTVVALLIGYLPTMYSAFSAREAAVNQLGCPRWHPAYSAGFHYPRTPDRQADRLTTFVGGSGGILFTPDCESHTTYLRSSFSVHPRADILHGLAAGRVLDTAASVAVQWMFTNPQANLRSHQFFVCLISIADSKRD